MRVKISCFIILLVLFECSTADFQDAAETYGKYRDSKFSSSGGYPLVSVKYFQMLHLNVLVTFENYYYSIITVLLLVLQTMNLCFFLLFYYNTGPRAIAVSVLVINHVIFEHFRRSQSETFSYL